LQMPNRCFTWIGEKPLNSGISPMTCTISWDEAIYLLPSHE
jgi:hypothetical protein